MEPTLIINEKQAKIIYPKADDTLRLWLEETFGKEVLSKNIIDLIDSWEAAAEYVHVDPVNDLPFKNPVNNRQIAANSFFMADVITEALLDGVILDWTNNKQRKWGIWLNNYTPGSGWSFGGSNIVWSRAAAIGGARLYVDTEEKAIYFATKFLQIINKYSNPIK